MDGLRELEIKSTRWGSEELISWLRVGFRELDSKRNTLDEYHVFYPLRFHPESSTLGQLIAFLRYSAKNEFWIADHLRKAIQSYLSDSVGFRTEEDERRFLMNLWRIYPALTPGADMVALARRYIRALLESGARTLDFERLIDAITVAAASAPISNIQMRFFQDLADAPSLWRDTHMSLFVDRYLEWQESPRLGWCELRLHYRDLVDRAMNPETVNGRALIALVADQVVPETVPMSFTVVYAHKLKANLYNIDEEGSGPFEATAPELQDIPDSIARLIGNPE
jgi:hypothetical protein